LVTLPRSIKQGPFYVINRNKVPSILVEFGFITNTKEALELIKEENQTAIAKSLHQAVKNFQNRKIN
jgi:N-acetylmuramoyl-L-alanine amidase